MQIQTEVGSLIIDSDRSEFKRTRDKRQTSLRTKLVDVMEFQLSYFKSKKWCYESAALNMPANLGNSAVATGLEKVSFHSNPKERKCQRMLKLPHNCTHLTASRVMLKIIQARLQKYVNHELLDVQAGFRKGRGTRVQIDNIHWIIEKARVTEKHLILPYWLCQRLWLCVS